MATREDIHLSISAWPSVLRLARRYGCEPMGTDRLPWDFDEGDILDDWCGTYFSNDGQKVSSKDAQAIADALELALVDMRKAKNPGEPKSESASETDSFFSGPEWEELIKAVIDICRKGAFYIL
jgi:hypothetical protein